MDDDCNYVHLLPLPDTLQSPSPVQKMREKQVYNDATIMDTRVHIILYNQEYIKRESTKLFIKTCT